MLRMVVSMLSHRLSEGLRVRAGGVVVRLSALEVNELLEDLMVHPSERGEGFHTEGPRHAPVWQGVSCLGCQYAGCQNKRDGRHIIQPRAERCEACP